ncbi:GGDEF domain-containing protein [Aminivibrio pyruvatiphilus]|jgi:GGDEF domain-containing protein|uniref:GGDEF domain-containing protein n=2 Tax=Aminivibrio pyruvatiphilus TaxID=1005740 RepID=A0A4R8M9J9_9BACT|nr:GGDEF domain-containing protein [Aminivibrio pyruvatiphilus]
MSAWITLPPFVSLPIAVALFFLGGQSAPLKTGAPFWALLMTVYFVLCAAYASAIRRKSFHLLYPVQLLSQGMIATVVSLESGTLPIISWLGVLSAVSGAFILLNHFLREKKQSREIPPLPGCTPNGSTAGQRIANIPLPALTTDSQGIVLERNDAFASLIPGGVVTGKPVTDFFIPGEDSVSLGNREYTVFQAPLDGLFFFALVELPKQRKKSATARGAVSLLDPATGLYSSEYASIRIPEELSRAFRYRRWLCGVLLAVEYTYIPGLNYQEEKESSFIEAFSAFVRGAIRDSDMAFYLGDRKILILLPETPQQGAKDVSLKLMDLPESLEELKKSFPFSVEIEYGFVYFSGNYPMTKDQFLEKLQSNLGGTSE